MQETEQRAKDDINFATPTQGTLTPTDPHRTPMNNHNSPLPSMRANNVGNAVLSTFHTVSNFIEILQGQTVYKVGFRDRQTSFESYLLCLIAL